MHPSSPVPSTNIKLKITSHQLDDDQPDEVDQMITATGCFNEHQSLQQCYLNTKDWRKCQEEMKKFKECFDKNNKSQETPNKD